MCRYSWQAGKANKTLSDLANANQRYVSWRASEASETLSGVYKFELVRYVYIYIFIT